MRAFVASLRLLRGAVLRTYLTGLLVVASAARFSICNTASVWEAGLARVP